MILLGSDIVFQRLDLGGYFSESRISQGFLIYMQGGEPRAFLVLAIEINSAAVIAPHVVALAIALGGIMIFPKFSQYRFQGYPIWIESHLHNFRMVPPIGFAGPEHFFMG